MNWSSPEGRALLRIAWPEGALWVRGIRTVGGWSCVLEDHEHDAEPKLVYVPETRGRPRSGSHRCVEALAAGDLLPNPDPADVATWACLLADIAAAVGQPLGTFWCLQPSPDVARARWSPDAKFLGWTRWTLVSYRTPAFGSALTDHWRHFDYPDPVKCESEALVHARVQIRESDPARGS